MPGGLSKSKCSRCGRTIVGVGEDGLAASVRAHEALHEAGHIGHGFEFEHKVAAIYQALGSKVEHDRTIAGILVDLLVTKTSPEGKTTKTAIECKAYNRPLDPDVVIPVAATAYVLKKTKNVDEVVLVSERGFTKAARTVGRQYDLELVDFAELRKRVSGLEHTHSEVRTNADLIDELTRRRSRTKNVFVVMPFSKKMEDVYIIGIREVAEKLGLAVERADDVQHNEGILRIIQDRISRCEAVIAETSSKNPNVFYEIGYSHAIGRPTILIARRGNRIPVDLRGMNFVLYNNVVDLRRKLEARLDRKSVV